MRVEFAKPSWHLITLRRPRPFISPPNSPRSLINKYENRIRAKGLDINQSQGTNPPKLNITDNAPNNSQPEPPSNSFLLGNIYLLVVSVLWGSYSPALRGIFNTPGAPSPLIVASARGLLQAALLGTAVLIGMYFSQRNTTQSMDQPESTATTDNKGSSGLFTLPLSPVVAGALEIGLYNTAGTLLQTWGLSLTSATRSAFLVQATALWTPMLAALFGMAPSPLLWVSSLIALVATLLVTFDQMAGAALAAGQVPSLDGFLHGASLGDLTTLAAAFAYSLATVRIPMYAQKVQPLHLAFGKSLMLALTSTVVLLSSLVSTALTSGGSTSLGAALAGLWPACCDQSVVWGLIAWSAVGPGAFSAYLHVKGQSMVGPTDAQVVFATVPLWSAIMAATFLPGETLGPLAWAGGAGMLMAGLVAAIDQAGKENRDEK